MKYEIVITEGCTSFCTMVNGKELGGYSFDQMNPAEVAEFAEYLFAKLRAGYEAGEIDLNTLLNCIEADDFEYDGTACDTCGDTVHRTMWKI